jgi:hypothetical protein
MHNGHGVFALGRFVAATILSRIPECAARTSYNNVDDIIRVHGIGFAPRLTASNKKIVWGPTTLADVDAKSFIPVNVRGVTWIVMYLLLAHAFASEGVSNAMISSRTHSLGTWITIMRSASSSFTRQAKAEGDGTGCLARMRAFSISADGCAAEFLRPWDGHSEKKVAAR